MECFIGLGNPANSIRDRMGMVCREAWKSLGVIPFTRYTEPGERWQWAEWQAREPIYILADDDCLPLPPFDIHTAIKLLEKRPEIAILAARPYDHIEQFTFDNDNFCEYNSVGGIRFIRKGILTFPPDFRGDDSEVGQIVYSKGYISGLIGSLERNHIGRGYSTEWYKK